jgi:ribosomal protein RSM22 (predicted rRNA methylase)
LQNTPLYQEEKLVNYLEARCNQLGGQVSKNVKLLWKNFNQTKQNLDKHYMSQKSFLNAYVAGFLYPNLARTHWALSQHQKFLNEILSSASTKEKNILKILDVGSGPLSASLGFVKVLSSFLEENTNFSALQEIHFYCVERSIEAVQIGEKILRECLSPSVIVHVVHCSSVLKAREVLNQNFPNESFGVSLCSNTLNEVPEKHMFSFVSSIVEISKFSLFLEPAQETSFVGLVSQRDKILASSKNLSVLGPCIHNSGCPLLEKLRKNEEKNREWCWFQFELKRPPFLRLLDMDTGLNHKNLNLSYFFMENKSTFEVENVLVAKNDLKQVSAKDKLKQDPNKQVDNIFPARIISDIIPVAPKSEIVAAKLQHHMVKNRITPKINGIAVKNINKLEIENEAEMSWKKISVCSANGKVIGVYLSQGLSVSEPLLASLARGQTMLENTFSLEQVTQFVTFVNES